MKTCSHQDCNNPVFSKGLCQMHWKQEYGKPITRKALNKPVYSTKAIKQVSTRQQRLLADYAAQRKVFLKNRPVCEAALTNCTFVATDLHHVRGRGEYLLDERYFLPLCRNCHTWINEHPAAAIEKGFCISRLSKTI
jgi:hypothetical protein